MALNPSGPISLGGTTAGQSIALENGGPGTAQIALNDAAVRSLAGVPTGQIVMPTDFWGKSNLFTFNVPAGTDVNLRSAALTAGWSGSGAVIATIQPGTTIQSSSTGGYALTINGSWPGGVTLDNKGLIVGRGGNGGQGGALVPGPVSPVGSGYPGNSAGTAVLVSVPVTINNPTGTIAGGGGGGGGGACGFSRTPGGGGGGGGGIGVGQGGVGGVGVNSGGAGGPGTAGTTTTAGSGGGGGAAGLTGGAGVPGGSAGGYASTGNPGSSNGPRFGGSGGAGGNSLSGNPLVSWPTGFGTMFGARV